MPLSWQYQTLFQVCIRAADLERISRASKTLARMVGGGGYSGGRFHLSQRRRTRGTVDTEDNRLVLLTGTLERFFNTIFRCSHTAKRRCSSLSSSVENALIGVSSQICIQRMMLMAVVVAAKHARAVRVAE